MYYMPHAFSLSFPLQSAYLMVCQTACPPAALADETRFLACLPFQMQRHDCLGDIIFKAIVWAKNMKITEGLDRNKSSC